MAGKPKGRGELLEMLRKQTEKTVGIDQAAIEALPPKARGRAALLHKLQQQVGANPKLMQVAAAVDPIPGPSTRESPARISSRVPELTMQEERKTFKGKQFPFVLSLCCGRFQVYYPVSSKHFSFSFITISDEAQSAFVIF